MTADEILKSIPCDAFAFGGRSPRKEFAIKLGFWQLLVPIVLTGIVMITVQSGQDLGEGAWRGLIYLLAALNLTFLLPVGVRRARDAGYPVGFYLPALSAAVWAFVVLDMSFPLWGLHAALLLARTTGANRPEVA